MLRLPFIALANLSLLVRTAVGAPFRMMSSGDRPTFIRFRLTGDPPYRERRRPRLPFGANRPEPADVTSVERFREALDLLAKDAHVKGVLLEVESLSVPAAKRDALVAVVRRFQGQGKRVVAWAVSVDNEAYSLLCAADEVLLAPMGRIELVGYAAEPLALGEGLSRAGIRAHFVRRGPYKTAPELFTDKVVSDIQAKTVETFLDERYADLVDVVARGRRKTPEEVKALIDRGPFSARRALDAGLVDALVSEADLPEHLGLVKDGGDAEETELEPMATYLGTVPFPPVRWKPVKRAPRLAVVPVSGMIVPGKGGGGRMATTDTVVKALRAAGRDKRSKAVVIYINSPGGTPLASEQMLEAVQRVARKKPVIAYMDRVCASAGYMVAVGAKEIWSSPHAMVGSIGVFAGKFEVSGLMEKLGVHRTTLARGENAAIFSSSRGFSPHEKETLEAEVEEMYQAFLDIVAKGRGRTKEEIHQLAEGRVYSGVRGKAVGLVDQISGFEDACRHALSLAKSPTEGFEITTYGGPKQRVNLLKLLMGASQSRAYALCPTALGLSLHGGTEEFEAGTRVELADLMGQVFPDDQWPFGG
ncbi:signal peptide peptidase SppA [Comamonas sp. JC664]|uniref:signal peptide peptidase SppA n=1 Tax=Comamonas sp. JC664 TaxID=2801917 RepID=UPI00174A864B|nr:signal peptide peptidase SppA [Comamonas sp. JC664]MBL0694483.1 signal peptide peptidase SppA [Comamonas sp. JC664]GHG77803.1 protease IV [Comamonas sp. KCTC 72670]